MQDKNYILFNYLKLLNNFPKENTNILTLEQLMMTKGNPSEQEKAEQKN